MQNVRIIPSRGEYDVLLEGDVESLERLHELDGPIRSLTTFTAINVTVSQHALSQLANLSIKKLNLSGVSIEDFGFVPKVKDLCELSATVEAKGSGNLQAISLAPNLTELSIPYSRMSTSDLAPLYALTRLERVDLTGSEIDGLPPEFAQLAMLSSICLEGTTVDDRVGAVLSNCKGLQRVNLAETQVTSSILRCLAALPQLDHLSIAATSQSDSWAQIGDLKPLSTLWLRNVNVDSLLAESFISMPNLNRVFLSEAAVNKGIQKKLEARISEVHLI